MLYDSYRRQLAEPASDGRAAPCVRAGPLRQLLPRGPKATPEDEARFKLLKAAYVDARYSMKYRISREDLEILASYVRELRARTERACREHIALLAAAAAAPEARH